MNPLPTVNLAPALQLLGGAALIAALLLAAWSWRHRHADARRRWLALSMLTAFLTADLIVFGSFTRLTDSGLGCPDWPGCYGAATPLGAAPQIAAAQQALPTGPVTHTKAWIEMIHRYLAMTVGALILVQAIGSWRQRARIGRAAAWSIAALVWVLAQGAFGKYTVTLKLYPAVVTLHLLGGMALLALLVAQFESLRTAPPVAGARALGAVALLLGLQIALGGWVSTNYAVLACRGFPMCNGSWWPSMDFAEGFALWRELGRGGAEGYIAFPALVAVHMTHRLMAGLVTLAIAALAAGLWRSGEAESRRYALALAGVLAAQWASGLSNVLLDWPLVAALVHSAGAAALTALVVSLWSRRRALAPTGRVQPGTGLRRHPA